MFWIGERPLSEEAGPVRPDVAIKRLGDVLLVTVFDGFDDKQAVVLSEELGSRLTGVKGVVLDVSRLEIVDSFAARLLVELGSMTRLLGARTVLAGLRHSVAITLAELGLGLPGLRTALSVEQALAAFERHS